MKKINVIYFVALGLFLTLALSSCKKKDVYPIFPEPTWQVNADVYSVSMTAVVKLPAHLQPYVQDNDQLAVFGQDDICRGIGYAVDNLYYVTIMGTPEDDTNIKFRYYSKRNQYMYQTGNLFQFETDVIYGTTDEPKEIPLSIVEQ